MNLQKKVSLVVLLIVGISAVAAEYINREYVGRLAQQNLESETTAVVRQIDTQITTLKEFRNKSALQADMNKLLASRPDLIEVALYALPARPGDSPALLVRAAQPKSPVLKDVPPLVRGVIESGRQVSDLSEWKTAHRLKQAAPITIGDRLAGVAFAEFSTAQFDEVLNYQQRLSFWRRIFTGGVMFLAINLFLYLQVHRPVTSLLSAVNALAQGDLRAKAKVRGRDEIGKLAQNFNTMVDRLRAANEENRRLYEQLQQAHDQLQVRVAEATAEIRAKNLELMTINERLSRVQREAARTQRLSAIGQLAATVAHKIGTPLTALSGHIQLLAEEPQLGDESRRRLRTIEEQIERTSKIIQDLLVYARKPEPVIAALDLNRCLEDCLVLVQPEMDRRKVRLDASFSPAVEKVRGDAQQLQELFCNLIENALDAMPKGGTLRTRTYRPGPSEGGVLEAVAAVDIADTGEGIAPEHLSQIFQPFFTTKKVRQGTGLGLAIVHEIIKAHGGRITVDSEVGKGTRFQLLLPAVVKEAS
jgi:signal transduction histidine kinase